MWLRVYTRFAFSFISILFVRYFQKTGVQSQVESYQTLKNWYLIHPYLTISNIRYGSRIKWSNPGKGVAPSPTPRCSSYWKRSFRVTLDDSRQLYFYLYMVGQSFRCMFTLKSYSTYNFSYFFHRPIFNRLIGLVSRMLTKVTTVQSQVESYQRLKNGTWCHFA